MNEQSPRKPITQQEIDSAKKKREATYSHQLKQNLVDLKIGNKDDGEQEEIDIEYNRQSILNLEKTLKQLGNEISNNYQSYSAEESQSIFNLYTNIQSKLKFLKGGQEQLDNARANKESVASAQKIEEKNSVKKNVKLPNSMKQHKSENLSKGTEIGAKENSELPQDEKGQSTNVPKKEELPPVIIHQEPPVESGNQENNPRVVKNDAKTPSVEQPIKEKGGAPRSAPRIVEGIRSSETRKQGTEHEKKKEYTPDQAKKALDILCGNGDFSLVPYNASAEDRALLGDIIKKDWKMVSPADREKMIPIIERTFTQRVIDKALELHEIKDAREAVRIDVLSHSKEKGISYEDALGIMKSSLREGDRRYALLEQSNRFEPTLKELKKLMLNDKAAALEEEFNGHGYSQEKIDEILFEKLVTGTQQKIFNEKKGEYITETTANSYEQLLLKMVFREQQIDQRKIEEIYSAEKMKHPTVFQQAMRSLAKIPRPWRSAIIGASLAGGGLAFGFGAGTAAAMSLPIFLGYRAIRSVTGGSFGYYLQKWAGEKIVDKTYSNDMRKAYNETVEARARQTTADEQLKELVKQRNFDEFAEKNYTYAKELDLEFRKKEAIANKYRRWNRGLMTVLTGVIGGGLGAQLIDMGADAAMGAVAGVGIEQTIRGGGNAPEHAPSPAHVEDMATAHKGDSVWKLIEEDATKNVKGFSELNEAQQTYFIDHLKDQVVADPHKFGLENADQIRMGYGKELQSLFENNQDVQNALESARHLSGGQMDSILQSNASQRVAFLDSVKPKFPHETIGTKSVTLDEVVVTGKAPTELADSYTIKGTDPYGVETTKELPIELKGNNELAQSYLNYKGNPNVVDGSQTQELLRKGGAENLVKLVEIHPEYLKIGSVRDALREIHTNNLVEELHEGGAFKFLNSADHEDLLRETMGLARTYGLDTYRAQSFADYIAQGHEMSEQTFAQFTDQETGAFLSDHFQGAISQFHDLETLTTPPTIPEGATSSFWEPRLLSTSDMSEPIVGLVRQSAPDIFEFKTPTGIINSGLNYGTMEKMIVKPPSVQ